MSTAFKLGLPTDIPWRRRCVTKDMIDRRACDERLPPKWQSSIAIFDFTPDDDYQQYDEYVISYLKVAVTITGYQAIDDEIQGQIDWNGLDTTTLEGVTELLTSYFPCTGAILQVVVAPEEGGDLDAYPFFMDFEPKKRELYEMATDTNERSSRSIESLSIGKSAGSTNSLEVLDVDMGGSTSVAGEASYAGTGGGFSYSSSNQGQWGTKAVNSDTSQSTRTTEVGTERRETQSFTTHLSQMYHLLDSYHLGTNRAVFFVQPRPHVLEEPSGFVRGPRKVEGMQEFFLVVANPKGADDFCVSARLDTGHLIETDVLDYETRSENTDLANASARVPTRQDPRDGTTTREACFFSCWDVTYVCHATHDVDDVIYQAPAGFRITGFTNLVNQSSNGSSSVTVTPNNQSLTVHAEARGRICFEDSGVCVDCPDEVNRSSGFARRQVQVHLRSTEPTRKVDTRTSLLITTRGLCCCPEDARQPEFVRVVDIPANLKTGEPARTHRSAHDPQSFDVVGDGEYDDSGDERAVPRSAKAKADDHDCHCNDAADAPRMTIQKANELNEFIRTEIVRTGAISNLRTLPRSFVETDLFGKQVEAIAARSRRGREMLDAPLSENVPRDLRRLVAERLHLDPRELSQRDLLRFRASDVAESGVSAFDLNRLKLGALGLRWKDREDDATKQSSAKPATSKKKKAPAATAAPRSRRKS